MVENQKKKRIKNQPQYNDHIIIPIYSMRQVLEGKKFQFLNGRERFA